MCAASRRISATISEDQSAASGSGERLSCGHAGSLFRAAARGLYQTSRDEMDVKEEVRQARPGARAAEARRTAGGRDPQKRSSRRSQESPSAKRSARRRSSCCRIRSCSIASSKTSHAAAWWARRPTSWSATSPPCRGIWNRRWPCCAVQFGRRQKLADGSHARVRSRRSSACSTRR